MDVKIYNIQNLGVPNILYEHIIFEFLFINSTANKDQSTVNCCQSLAFDRHIYHVKIIVTSGFSKKSFFIFRSSHAEMFFKTGVIRNFCNIHRKESMLESLFNFISTSPHNTGDSCENCKIFTNSFFYGTPPVAALVSSIK